MSKILIIDDNVKNVQVLAKILSNNGYSIEYTTNGADAINWVREDHFDLILLDIMMPEMNGFETCHRIKSIKGKENLPIIFVTAKTDTESINKAFQEGGVDYLTKPFNTDELLARVKVHIELKQSKDKLNDINAWLQSEVSKKTSELSLAKKELESLDAAKNDFLSFISHELRTPLNGLIPVIQMYKDDASFDSIKTVLELLESSVKKLERFSTTALNITNLQLKKENALFPIEIPLENIVFNIEKYYENDFSDTETELSIDQFDKDLQIYMDETLANKVFEQLLKYSILHLDNQGKVTLSVQKKAGSQVSFWFLLHDKRFRDEYADNIFSSFSSDQQVYEVSSLDLFLIKLIVETHKGAIVSGNEDNNAFIELSLPEKSF